MHATLLHIEEGEGKEGGRGGVQRGKVSSEEAGLEELG
jgi:hypothetical protein